MLWSDVRSKFPEQFVLVEELASHTEDDKIIVDEVAVVRPVTEQEATNTLMECKDRLFVYHTSSDEIVIWLRHRPGLRGRLSAH